VSTIPGKAPAVKMPPHVETGRELLQLAQEISDDELEQAVQQHLAETRGHVERVRKAFEALGEEPSGRPALGLDGLRKERESTAPDVAPGLRAGANCQAAMGTEHYEINTYDAAIRLADALGEGEAGGLLRENLNEEVAALEKLAGHADRLAKQAAQA
jgi:ferritin-like metal-binding protein YciE